MEIPGFKTLFRPHREGHGKRGGRHTHPHGAGGAGDAENSAPETRTIPVVRRVLDVNEAMARQNREMFSGKGIFVINVMSSPGSGKTTLLVKTLSHLMPEVRCAVIVGDICTTNDADRLAESGAPVVQVNTDEFGGDCHLAAHVIENATRAIDLDNLDLLIVENVGNLVCPAEFDIGEDARAVVLSVTEGEDKPLKYPLMFRVCDVALLSKIDLLPHLDFDIDEAERSILQVKPDMPILRVSSRTGDGFDAWIDWLKARIRQKKEQPLQ